LAAARGTISGVDPRPSLLLVEDDSELSGLLSTLLGDSGYTVDVAADGDNGLRLGLTRPYSALIVDRGLPVRDGLDVIDQLRSNGVSAPVLVLSARGTVADRVEGLDAGAEDYLTKPFDVDELLARLRALLRRHPDQGATISLGRRELDLSSRLVSGDGGGAVALSVRECELLQVLAANPTRVFTREELLARVFADADNEGVVDTYVHYLRRKLGRPVIRTVRGVGYRMGTA
jgi:two-component system response regulator QseB